MISAWVVRPLPNQAANEHFKCLMKLLMILNVQRLTIMNFITMKMTMDYKLVGYEHNEKNIYSLNSIFIILKKIIFCKRTNVSIFSFLLLVRTYGIISNSYLNYRNFIQFFFSFFVIFEIVPVIPPDFFSGYS